MDLGLSCLGIVLFLGTIDGIIYGFLKKNNKVSVLFSVLFFFTLCGIIYYFPYII